VAVCGSVYGVVDIWGVAVHLVVDSPKKTSPTPTSSQLRKKKNLNLRHSLSKTTGRPFKNFPIIFARRSTTFLVLQT